MTIAEDFCMDTTISGLVILVTKTSPEVIFFKSSKVSIIFIFPTAIPGEAASPVNITSPSIFLPSASGLFPRVVIGLV